MVLKYLTLAIGSIKQKVYFCDIESKFNFLKNINYKALWEK